MRMPARPATRWSKCDRNRPGAIVEQIFLPANAAVSDRHLQNWGHKTSNFVDIKGAPMLPELKEKKASDFYWYHSVDLLNGEITSGDYDINEILRHYHFPDDMRGLSVLDVGRGSGAFAFEFERRGAQVVATDLPSFFDWDFVGGEPERKRRAAAVGDKEIFSETFIHGAFEFAKEMRKSDVQSKFINVYDLSPDAFDGKKFDIVFGGSITSHLRDPLLAFERLFSVTKTKCIVSAPSFDSTPIQAPLMRLVTGDSDRRSWWVLNDLALTEMLRSVGFQAVDIVSKFDLQCQRTGASYEHLVAHAIV